MQIFNLGKLAWINDRRHNSPAPSMNIFMLCIWWLWLRRAQWRLHYIFSIENPVWGLVIVISLEYSPRVMLVVVAFSTRLEWITELLDFTWNRFITDEKLETHMYNLSKAFIVATKTIISRNIMMSKASPECCNPGAHHSCAAAGAGQGWGLPRSC